MQPTWKHLPPIAVVTLLCALFFGLAQPNKVQAAPAAVANPTTPVFINEVHYDNAGTDTGEFVEIAGPAGTDLTGWTVVLYNGSGGAVYDTDALPTQIPSLGCDYGFVVINYPSNGIQNGAPDGIALVDNNGSVVQFLSYEGAFVGVGGPANGLASTNINVLEAGGDTVGQSLRLSGNGTTYGNFTWNGPAAATPGAINTGQSFGSGGDTAPCLTSVAPANNSAGVALNADITVNFTEPVDVSGNWFDITCTNSGAHSAAYSGGPQTYAINPDGDFSSGESCTVTLVGSQIVDQDGTPQPMNSNVSWTFETTILFGVCADNTETAIHTVQGGGATSPRTGKAVVIEGVVVGDYQGNTSLSGFYLQEEDADADSDAATSEGIFVFNNTEVNAGDVVRLQGTITEFGGTGATLTEITNVTQLLVCSTGATVTPATIDMPVTSLADWERVEGMLVNIPEQLTVTENFTLARFGEVVLSADGRLYQATHLAAPGAAAQAQLAANTLNRIVLDDAKTFQNPDPVIHPDPFLSANNTLRTGYTVDNLTGILDQRFNLYRIQPLGVVAFAPANPRTPAPEAVGGRLTVASANVLNFFTTLDEGSNLCGPLGNEQECRGADSAFEFGRQRAKILNGLGAINADIIGLVELENNPTASLDDLVAGLNAMPGVGPYAYINTGYIGTDAIKVALIYKPATVTPVGNYAILDTSVDPRFLDTKNRPVLAQTFQENATTERFTVAVNHLKSKGSDCNDVSDPDTGDGQGNCNLTRTAAATAMVEWLAGDPTGVGDPDFLIIGDLNSYAMEDPITTLTNQGYVDLLKQFNGAAAYSYVFDGQSGYLDHALANASLAPQVTGATEWHVNTDEPIALDYNVDFKSAAQVDYFYTPEAYRFSDHDPLVVGLDLDADTTITLVKDSKPDSRRNFRFSGDLGDFRLDDPGFNENDPFNASITFEVEHGTYTVIEDVPHFWHLTDISCAGGSTSTDLAGHSVGITVVAGQHVTCTFTNEYGSALWVNVYHDRNADGTRVRENGLKGWEISLYNEAGTVVASDITNGAGKVHFWNVVPGQYTLCETQQSGWFNSEPGTLDPTYSQPCYALTIGPAELWEVDFGNHQSAQATAASVATPSASNVTPLTVEDVDDESYEDDGTIDDPTLNIPEQGEGNPIFLPQITR